MSCVRGSAKVNNFNYLKTRTREDFYGLTSCPENNEIKTSSQQNENRLGPPESARRGEFSGWGVLPEIRKTGCGLKPPDPTKRTYGSDPLPLKSYTECQEQRLYPYRYSSAGPSVAGGTYSERRLRECVQRVTRRAPQVNVMEGVRQRPGYETTSLTAALRPYSKSVVSECRRQEQAERLNPMQTMWKLHAPYKASTTFSQAVCDTLHPDWCRDPKYRHRVVYHSLD